jgi:uncharacterized membrane protein
MSQNDRQVESGSDRLETFSDSVMAVILTLMAFQLRPPAGVSLVAVRAQLPGLLVYVLSFTLIGTYWNNHHHLLRATSRISAAVMWANLLLLFCLSLVPVMTEWMRDYYKDPLPAAAYGLVGLAAAISYTLLVKSIIRANGADSVVATAISKDVKGYASLGLYTAGVALAAVSPWISYGLYAAVLVMWLVPDRRFTRDSP